MKKRIELTSEQYAALHALLGQTTGELFTDLYRTMGKRVIKEQLPKVNIFIGGHNLDSGPVAYAVKLPFIRLTVEGKQA